MCLCVCAAAQFTGAKPLAVFVLGPAGRTGGSRRGEPLTAVMETSEETTFTGARASAGSHYQAVQCRADTSEPVETCPKSTWSGGLRPDSGSRNDAFTTLGLSKVSYCSQEEFAGT